MVIPLLLLGVGLLGSTPQAHTESGLRHLSYFDFQGALREFEAALQLQPESEVARVNVALAEYYLGEFSDSLQNLEIARRSSPDSPYVLFVLGILKKVTDEPEEAAKLFERVIQIDPDDFGAYYQLGLLEFSAGSYDRAIDRFRQSLNRNPECTSASYNLARALLRTGQTEKGRLQLEHFKQVRDHKEIPTRSGMGDPAILQGKYAQARRFPHS